MHQWEQYSYVEVKGQWTLRKRSKECNHVEDNPSLAMKTSYFPLSRDGLCNLFHMITFSWNDPKRGLCFLSSRVDLKRKSKPFNRKVTKIQILLSFRQKCSLSSFLSTNSPAWTGMHSASCHACLAWKYIHRQYSQLAQWGLFYGMYTSLKNARPK
jgi:hypothetical protein